MQRSGHFRGQAGRDRQAGPPRRLSSGRLDFIVADKDGQSEPESRQPASGISLCTTLRNSPRAKPLGAWAILALASSDAAFRAYVGARLSRWEQSRARRRLEQRGLLEIAPRLRQRGVARRYSASAESLLTLLEDARAPTNASQPTLRQATHSSGPTWIATPLSYDYAFAIPRRFSWRYPLAYQLSCGQSSTCYARCGPHTDLIRTHMLHGIVASRDMAGEGWLQTMYGDNLPVDVFGAVVLIDGAQIVRGPAIGMRYRSRD